MLFIKLQIKKLVMATLYLFLLFWGVIRRRKMTEVKSVAVLFTRILGIGDLVMISPLFKYLHKIFPQAKITLITWTEDFIDLDSVRVLPLATYRKNKEKFDLVISPTLNLKHIPFIFSAKYWMGYFATSRIQSNLGLPHYSYNMRSQHFLWRVVYLVKALDKDLGEKFAQEATAKNVSYPNCKTSQPDYFIKELQGKKYLALGVFLKFADRMWPLEKVAQVIGRAYQQGYFDKVVLLGDKSQHNRSCADKLLNLLSLPSEAVLDLTGRNNLAETCYILQHCSLFFGLDTGPAHLAYLLSPHSLVLFFTVDPQTRLPLNADRQKRITYLFPPALAKGSIYDGSAPVPLSVANKLINQIKVEQVGEKINSIMNT